MRIGEEPKRKGPPPPTLEQKCACVTSTVKYREAMGSRIPKREVAAFFLFTIVQDLVSIFPEKSK